MASPENEQQILSDQLSAVDSTDAINADVLDVDADDLGADVLAAPAFNPKKDTAKFRSPLKTFTPEMWNVLKATTREALGVWLDEGKVWKVYSTDNQYKKVNDVVLAAKNAELPIAGAEVKKGETSRSNTKPPFTPWKASFSIITDHYTKPWVFFSGQRGGLPKFTNLIQGISNKTTLTSLQVAFERALEIKLTDPQGFINSGMTENNIQFIDLHVSTSSGTPPVTENMLGIVNEQLAKQS